MHPKKCLILGYFLWYWKDLQQGDTFWESLKKKSMAQRILWCLALTTSVRKEEKRLYGALDFQTKGARISNSEELSQDMMSPTNK